MDSRRKSTNLCRRGFTLVELLIVLAITMFIAAMVAPSYHLFLSQTGVRDAAAVYVQTLRRAQTLSEAARGDSHWGVYVATSSIILYKGTSYASRDGAYDESYNATLPFSASGLTDISFSKVFGIPSAVGVVTIEAYGAQPYAITINEKGMVNY